LRGRVKLAEAPKEKFLSCEKTDQDAWNKKNERDQSRKVEVNNGGRGGKRGWILRKGVGREKMVKFGSRRTEKLFEGGLASLKATVL